MGEDIKEKYPGESSTPRENDEALFNSGQIVKKTSFYPRGRKLDGCPYAGEPEFVDDVIKRFGEETLIEEVEKIGGDPDCLNWLTWAGINLTETLNPQKKKEEK